MTVVVGVLSSVIAALLLAALGLVWRHRRRIAMMPGAAWRRMRAKAPARKLGRLRQRVLDRADEAGIALAVSASGGDPQVGHMVGRQPRLVLLPRSARYRGALQSGRAPLANSFWNSEPPTPIGAWSQATLEIWLAEH
ncbi:MAG: hypothetical protein QOE23_253 [Pseudonocardiales bacterium]|jgi:hypothetical protein|nr:hypothetical protein [Pseudonocardiales bacterium]